jgi:hypothetical protein
MEGALGELNALFLDLIEDVELLSRNANESSNARRSYIRAVFALVEGLTHAMKQVALSERGVAWTSAELALLAEEAYRLDSSGRPETANAAIPLLPNVRFAFGALAKSCGADFELSVSGTGWQALQRSLKTRHRIMHPRTVADITLSSQDADEAGVAFRWFIANLALCLRAVVGSLSARSNSASVLDLDRIEKYYGRFAS